MNIISGTTIQEYNLFANRTPSKASSASLSEETSVATILNLCPDLPLPRANRWTTFVVQPFNVQISAPQVFTPHRLASKALLSALFKNSSNEFKVYPQIVHSCGI